MKPASPRPEERVPDACRPEASRARRRWLAGCALAAVVPGAFGQGSTAPWPSKPIHLVVAYPPGGISDDVARALAEKVAAQLGVQVLVENKAGNGGGIAIEALARAEPDGYTLCFASISPLTLLPLVGKVAYDPVHDIAPVIGVMRTPVMLAATPAFTGKRFADVLAAARQKPGRVRWASSGAASLGHMVLEQIRATSHVDIAHIPYKGGGQQLTDALSGTFEILSTNIGTLQMQYVREGKLRPLAVGAPQRLESLPDVPTLAELGFPQANLMSVFGIFAPAATPREVLLRLNVAFDRALRYPDVRQRLLAGYNLVGGGPADSLARAIARETKVNRGLLESGALKLQ